MVDYTERLRRVLEAARFVLEQEQEIVQDGYVASLVRLRYAVEAVKVTQATAAVVDYTERALQAARDAAVATTSRVQQAHEAKLARLQEPDVQDAIAKAFGEVICSQLELERIGEGDKQRVHFILRGKALDFSTATIAAIAVIKEMLK